MPNWPEDPRRRNVYGDVYGHSLPMPGQPQGIPSLADLATLVSQQQPQPAGLPSPTFQQQQPSWSQLQPPLMPQSQQAVAATDQPPKKPFFSLPDVANAIYEGATQQFIPSVKGTIAQLYSGGDRPDLQPEWVQRYQSEGRAAQEMAQRRTDEQAAAGKLSSSGEAVRQAIPSLPFSLGSMAAAIPAGIAGTVATGPVGGAVAAGAAAGAAGYRMAESQFLGDAFAKLEEESKKARGRGLNEQEKVSAYRELKPIAEHTGLWEAGPEAIGNAAMFGLGRVALGFMPKEAMQNLAKTALGRVGIRAGAAAGAAGTEVATETATQVAQGNDQAKADAAIKAFVEGKPMGPAIAGAERPYDGLAGLQKAYNDVVGATLATVVMMGGLAKGAHLAYKPIANRIEAGRRGQEADTAVNQTDPIRTNLEFARESDIAEALSRFDEIESAGRLPKSAARRIDAARQQLLGELSLRVSPESIAAPMNSQRGLAGYLGFSERVNELDDAQLADLAGRALPENAEPTLTEAANRYQAEIGRRQALTDAAVHFEQNPDAVAGVAKTLNDIASGKPMSKGAHGSTAFNLASLSDDMLRRYQLAGEVLSSQYADKVDKARELLNEEAHRRATGQTRDPEAIREADLAERAAAAIADGKEPNIKGLSFETLERMASGLEARASLEPRLADSARMLREAAQQGRMRAFNPQGQQQPGIQSAMRGWNTVQPEAPARSQEIAALNQQNPPLATPQGLPTVTPAAIPQSLGQLGQTRLGAGVDQLPIPVQPQPSTPNVTESQSQGRQETSPMGLPARPTGASQGQSRGTPEQAASALLRQVPGRLGEQARLNQERVRPKSEWQAFGPDTGTLGIPRADMPQVKAEHRGALVNFLNARGVAHEQDMEVDPTTLKPTQAEFSPKKVQQANEYQGGNRSILVSSDGHVVDGHHQWLSALSKGDPIKAIRLDAPIADLLPLVKEFPSSTESKTTTQPQPEQRREERQAEAAPLLSQEAEQKGNVKKPKAKGVAPTWNDANEIERAAMISRSSEKAGASVSNAFAQRKAAEWKTWADIPEGPAKKRLRDYMKSVEQMSMPATMDGGKAAPEKTKNPYATSEERDEAISRLENAARNSEYRAIRENADLIGDAAKMGATEAEMMAAIEAGDGKALERIADRQHEKTGGLLLGFGNGKLSKPFGYKNVERHPAHDYKNWEKLTDAQVNAFSKAASIKPGKTRQETLDRIDSRKTPAEWAEAWDKAFPENQDYMADISRAENTPNRTESQGKEPDKKADIRQATPSGKQEYPPSTTTAQSTKTGYGKSNKIFTEDAAAKARAILRAKLGQLNAGIDPEMIQAGITLAGYHIEAGARDFAAYAKAMLNDLGEQVRPYLRSWYEGVRHYPEFDRTGMTRPSSLDQSEKYGLFPGDRWNVRGEEKEVSEITENYINWTDGKQTPTSSWMGMRKAGDVVKISRVEESDKISRSLDEVSNKQSGATDLAERVRAYFLTSLRPLTPNTFWGMADNAFGGTQAQGAYNSKDAYDAMELGLNLALLDQVKDMPKLTAVDVASVKTAINYLESLQSRIPTQTRRDDEQQRMQQFSTPHTHSHVAAWVANITQNDEVLEPTAGTGNLVTHAKLFGPERIVANELSKRRDALLRQISGVRVLNENANHLNAILPADVKPTVVLMNPPFSADISKVGKKDLDVGAIHVEQALQRLQPGGRLVAIVGRGMAMDTPRFSKWWNDIEKQYNVRADVGISGKEYTKFGTSFDNRMMVIDKTGPTESRSNIVRGQVDKVSDLVDLLQGVRNDRQTQRANADQQPSAIPASETGAPNAPREAEPGATVPAATGPAVIGSNAENRPRGPTGSARRTGRATAQPGVATADTQPDNSGAVPATPEQPESPRTSGHTAAATAGQPESQRTDAEPVSRVEIEARGAIAPTDQKGFGESRFDAYSPSVSIKNAKPHPTQLAESGAMASVSFPKLTYAPKLPADIIKEGRLSDAQLETIAYAGQSHEMLLPNGERRGFFVGDGTGVGKGAQIAGIILDNWNQGRKKAVWISENARLFNDAQRDAEWVSLGKRRVFEQGKIKGEIGIKEGVAFTTYATLKSAERDKAGQKGKTRLDQLSDWLGKDFEGVIAFDEAHNMANAIARKGSRGVQQGSESARVGIELQKRFPKARVVYVSATGATEVHNLAYASRLGLWGEGTAFSNREAFIDAIHSGGLAAMEVVAKDTKSSGLYTARSLSYDGVEVETLQHELTTKQREMYDGMARAWQIVLRNIDAAMEAAQSKKNAQARSSALSAFWGAHQRFFNAILTSLSAPSLIKDVQSHLDNEHSVVMQLVNTNEATMERRMAQAADTEQELEELDLTPRDILMQYLQNSFPTTLYEEYLDEEGNTKTRPVMDAAGNVVQSPQALAARDRLQEQLATLDVPEGILEQVINHFGSSQVAEITGRKRRLVRQKDGKVTEEKLGASKTKVDAADFDQGKKRILIFSDAGGTGRSYHADLRIPNQQKRIHYLVQPGWRADKAIQGLGRTHRTNQKQPPLVKLVTTTLKSQKRFISSIARRMDQMGALTKGQRDANSQGIFDDDANLENEYSTMALNALFHDIARGKTNGITVADIEREMGLTIIDPKTGQVLEKNIPPVQRFLNRLLSLESDSMNRVFDAFDTRRRAAVEYAKQVGAYDAGMESLVAESIKKVDDVVAAKHPMGGETRYVKLESEVKNKIIDFDMLRTAGIQFAKSVKTGKLYAFEEAESVTNPETGDLITRRRRISTTNTAYVRETDLKNSDHYETIRFSDANAMRAAWNDEIARTPKTRKETVHLIAGALLPIWDRLPMSSNRVIRAQTDSGERLIGRVIKNNDLSATLRQLGVGVAAPKLDGKAALAAILDDHSTLVLSNGWRLMRRIVNGSPRVEVVPKEGRLSGGDRALLEDMGAFSEMVNWQFRAFLPTDNPGIVDRLFASKPLLEVVEPENRRSVPAASQSTGATISQARAQLVAALNERSVSALERSGKLILHRTDPTHTGAAGYVDPQGAIHLIPSNMDQDALSVALHEAMHLARDDRFSEGDRARIRFAHAALKITGLKNFIGNPGFSNLVQQLHRLAAEGNKTAIEALDKARREAPGNIEDEALAYLVQYADEKLPLVRRIIAAIRAALYRMGIKVELTPADVRALALSALKARAKDAALVQTVRAQESFSLPEFAPTESDKAEVERQMKAIKEILDGQGRLLAPNGKPSNLNERQWKQVRTKFFNDWFGDWENDPRNASKVVDDNGEPLVVYHGSPDARFVSEDATFKSQKERYGFGSELGVHWFASSENTAKTYADVRRAFDYQNADPGVISAFLNIRDPIKIDAGGKKWRDAQKIGKTSDVIDQAHREERDGVIIDNVKDNYQTGVVKGDRPTTTFSVFRSSQIKSAISNAGTFSARSNRIDYSQPTTETDASEQDRLWQEFQAVRAQFQAKQASQSAFDRWFGKGAEGVNARNGKPLVLYHGTNNPEFNRWDESRSGQASQHPTAGLGFFMTADKRSAARYGSRLLELHAKIDNPYYMTDADLVSIEDTQDAARFRRKMQAQGYDAAVISAPGGAPYVVALRSNQVKLASNENPTESDDFRYSRPGGRQPLDSPRLASKVLDDIGGVRSTLKPGERALAKANPSNFKQMLSDLSADTRPAWLGFLTRNMQLELAKEVLPAGPVAQFEKSAEQLDADESKMIQTEGFPLADRWQDMMRKDRAQADAVGRALYMSTWLGVDPRTKAPNGKQAEWVRAKAAYDALNSAAKQLYGDVLGFYQKQTDRMFMELDARIDRHSIPAPDKKAMRDQLRREFERVKQDGPYAPLMRFGDLTVFAEPRKAGDKPVFATFESVAEQRAFSDYLKREGYAPQLGVKMEEVVKRNLPQGDFVDDLAAAIDRTMSGPEAQIIKDSMYQLFLRSLPEQAIRKHFMHRKFVPGYSADALRTFATFARRSAKQVARLKHGDLMSDALNQMMKAVKSGTLQEPVAAGHLVNELDKTFQWAMAPTTAQWASKLTSLGFMWHLGASPAHLLLNLSQQAQVTAPWLAGELHGKMGFGSVASALLKANKDFIASNPFVDPAKRSATANKRRQALEAEFGGDLGRALTALEEAGKTDKTQTYSLAGLSEEDSFLWSKPYLRKAIQGAAWFFHTAEVVNREASAIAAYRLGRRSGLNHDQAYDLARRAINESHFDYSPSNRARYMRGNVAKVLTLFKQYSLNISWQLGRNAYLWARGQSPEVRAKARTKLLGMLGMTAVMAGAAGMPFYGEVMWMLTQLMNATRDDDEPEKDADLEFRRLLDFAFAPTASEAVRKGLINAFVGVDFSSRIKLDDLWWRSDNRDLSGRDAAYAAMEQALGPVAGLAVRGYSTIDELLAAMVYGENARGDSWRAMETSMPKMLKDISRSIRYMKEGATTYQGARILDPGELSTGAVVGQALGFAPAALADQYEINSAKMKIQTHILRQRRALLDTYAMARAQNDDEVKKAAIEDMRAFNKRYPTIAITRQTLLRSMTSRDRRKAEVEKSGGVALDRRLVDAI